MSDPDDMIEVQPVRTAHQRAVSENGIGSLRWIGGTLTRVLHLPITPAERENPIEFAIPALAGGGRAHDPFVALHTSPDTGGFIEQLVTREQLG